VEEAVMRAGLLLAAGLALAGCARQAPAPKAAQAPAVATRPAFLAPQRGQILSEGQSFTIRWQAPGWDSVNVGAAMGGKDRGHLAFGRNASGDTLVWHIPVGWVTGFGVTRSDSVRLRLEDARDPNQFVDSAPFTVTGKER
jgi:hypothetical protein